MVLIAKLNAAFQTSPDQIESNKQIQQRQVNMTNSVIPKPQVKNFNVLKSAKHSKTKRSKTLHKQLLNIFLAQVKTTTLDSEITPALINKFNKTGKVPEGTDLSKCTLRLNEISNGRTFTLMSSGNPVENEGLEVTFTLGDFGPTEEELSALKQRGRNLRVSKRRGFSVLKFFRWMKAAKPPPPPLTASDLKATNEADLNGVISTIKTT